MKSFDELDKFKKEFKRLFTKYNTLNDDFEKFKKVLAIYPAGIGKNFVIIHSSPRVKIVKAHMACRALRNNHLLRVIYAYFEQKQKIEFIEVYYKGDKENEDRNRIKIYLEEHQDKKES